MRHFNVKNGEHIGILKLTKKQAKPKNSPIGDHLLFGTHPTSYDDLCILTVRKKCFRSVHPPPPFC